VNPRAGSGPASRLPSPFHALVSLSHAVAQHPRVVASGLPVAVAPASIDTALFDPHRFDPAGGLDSGSGPGSPAPWPGAGTHLHSAGGLDSTSSARDTVDKASGNLREDAMRRVVQLRSQVAGPGVVHLDGESASPSDTPIVNPAAGPRGPARAIVGGEGVSASPPEPAATNAWGSTQPATSQAFKLGVEPELAGLKHRHSCPWGRRYPLAQGPGPQASDNGAHDTSHAYTVYGFMARCVVWFCRPPGPSFGEAPSITCLVGTHTHSLTHTLSHSHTHTWAHTLASAPTGAPPLHTHL
jgi:hypothetical protein